MRVDLVQTVPMNTMNFAVNSDVDLLFEMTQPNPVVPMRRINQPNDMHMKTMSHRIDGEKQVSSLSTDLRHTGRTWFRTVGLHAPS